MKRSIRLAEQLVSQAETEGTSSHRSIASQIEYWATIGRQVEADNKPSRERLNALEKFNTTFINHIQSSTSSGEFKETLFKKHPFVFIPSKMGPGYVDKVFADGTQITGRVVKGEFVEQKASGKKASRSSARK